MKRFALMRHAKTLWNLEKKIQGREDLPLSPQGEMQAEKWAKKLDPFSIDIIISSPMIRAHQTSIIIAEKTGLAIELEHDLREQDFGDWEGKTIKDLRAQFPGILEAQEKRGWDFCPPKGEPRHQVLDRAMRALTRAAEKKHGSQCLVVTHNSVMKCLIYKALGLAFDPKQKKILRPNHLHLLGRQNNKTGRQSYEWCIEQINALDLDSEEQVTKEEEKVPCMMKNHTEYLI